MPPSFARLLAIGGILVLLHTGALYAAAGGGDHPRGQGSPSVESPGAAPLERAPLPPSQRA